MSQTQSEGGVRGEGGGSVLSACRKRITFKEPAGENKGKMLQE